MGTTTDNLQLRIRRLADEHQLALRGLACGLDTPHIAALLDIPNEAVRPTLQVAAAKLLAALAEETPAADST